jgi:hypothetical protein
MNFIHRWFRRKRYGKRCTLCSRRYLWKHAKCKYLIPTEKMEGGEPIPGPEGSR